MSLKSLIPSIWSDDGKHDDIFSSLHKEIDRVFDSFKGNGPSPFTRETALAPRIDVSESDGDIRISAELPGVRQEDLKVEFANGLLTISGEKKSEQEDKSEQEGRQYHRIERSYGSFRRAMRLPDGVDADSIDAAFKDGVLTVTVNKPPELAKQVQKIEVKAS